MDTTIFHPPAVRAENETFTILFPGGLQWHQGLDLALRAYKKVRAELPRTQFHIYGDGDQKAKLVALASELGLNGSVRFFDPLPVGEIAQVMGQADLGVVPKRADGFGNEAYSTKIMEFMAVGVPVVVAGTKIDLHYFNNSVVRFFEAGNVDALAVAMVEVIKDVQLRQRLGRNGLDYAAIHSWGERKASYLDLVDSLIENREWAQVTCDTSPGEPATGSADTEPEMPVGK